MESRNGLFYGMSALFLALGISVGGYFIGNMMYKSRTATNLATVKGLAEREVKANVGAWTIPFEANGENLKQAYQDASSSKEKIIQFLKKSGFDEKEIMPNPVVVNKKDAKDKNDRALPTVYSIDGSVAVRSEQVDKIAEAAQHAGDLVGQGVMISKDSESYNNKASAPQYQFTKLNDIKLEMLGEATRNARLAAEQFAKDANAKVGHINAADQGSFSLYARDNAESGSGEAGEGASMYKKVRVVTTISFYLEN